MSDVKLSRFNGVFTTRSSWRPATLVKSGIRTQNNKSAMTPNRYANAYNLRNMDRTSSRYVAFDNSPLPVYVCYRTLFYFAANA